MKNIFLYNTKVGILGIAEENHYITNVFFQSQIHELKHAPVTVEAVNKIVNAKGIVIDGESYSIQETKPLREASSQLQQYFSGSQKGFELPLAPQGTAFMKSIWECLMRIPYGETRSYKEIAQASGNIKASRAVGMANNRNPLPFFIPCHRVIGSDGKLIGYRGGLEIKKKLLELEKKHADI